MKVLFASYSQFRRNGDVTPSLITNKYKQEERGGKSEEEQKGREKRKTVQVIHKLSVKWIK